MRRTRTTSAAIAAIIAAASLTACGSSGSDYQTCKTGLEQAVDAGKANASPPAACSHLSQAQVDKITQQVMNRGLRKIMQGSAPSN